MKKIHVKKNDVRDYNTTFASLLNGIEPCERPPETVIINYYVRGLYGTKYFNTMVLKDYNTLKEAMSEVEKMINSFEKYEDNNGNQK